MSRVLILAPWFRTLARKHADALSSAGHDVLIVTTPAQGDRMITRHGHESEILIGQRLKSIKAAYQFIKAFRRVSKWHPDIALIDDTWDPRFHLLGARALKSAVLVHDAQPHDIEHQRQGWKARQTLGARARASWIAAFSPYVVSQLAAAYPRRVLQLTLTSEIPWHVENLVPKVHEPRILYVGRISPYKGVDYLLESWRRARSLGVRGVLGLAGFGTLPKLCEEDEMQIVNEVISDDLMITLIQGASVVVLPYREASQSGIQLVAGQLGVRTIVTNVGSLPEWQVEKQFIVDFGDVGALATLFGRALEHPITEAERDAIRCNYEQEHGLLAVRKGLEELVQKC